MSTSYEHYIRSLCEYLDFPFGNTYCTRLNLDNYSITAQEKAILRSLAKEISAMNMIEISPETKSLKDLEKKDQETVNRLDEIFWEKISQMSCGRIFSEVIAVGGEQKAEAIRDIANKIQIPLSNILYVGDSITDIHALKLVRENGGLTISFNGNNFAVKNAEVAILSENNIVVALIAEAFIKYGKAQTLQIVENWKIEFLENNYSYLNVLGSVLELYPKALPKVQIVTPKNMESLSIRSSKFRKKVRGEAIGKLG